MAAKISLIYLILSIPALLLSLAILGVIFFISLSLYRLTIGEYFNSYSHIPAAPHSGSWLSTLLLGDFREIKEGAPASVHIRWMKSLGGVYRYRHMLNVQRILLADPKAMMHVLNKSSNYPKPGHTSIFLRSLLGEGLVTTEGDLHKKQRKIVAPAFTPSATRSLQPVMDKHACRLVDKIDQMISLSVKRTQSSSREVLLGEHPFDLSAPIPTQVAGSTAVIDVLFWLSRTALDIIGEAGFDHHFNSLEQGDDPDELVEAFGDLMDSILNVSLYQAIPVLLSELPGLFWLRDLPTKANRATKHSQTIVRKHATEIVKNAKAEIEAEIKSTTAAEKSSLSNGNGMMSKELFNEELIEKNGKSSGRALLFRMIRANMAEDLKASERLSDEEMLGQMSTLILAGHETTATQTSWALHLLASNPTCQDRLREELLKAKVINETFDEEVDHLGSKPKIEFENLMNLPYLSNVSNEIIRIMPSIVSTVRVVKEDDVVPLSKSYPNAKGKDHGSFNSVVLHKGHELFIPIAVLQQSEEIWGSDAATFNPDRWEDLPQEVLDAKLPSQTLAFIAGNRSCVGQRMAVMELKVLLAHLVSSFKFSLVDGYELEAKQQIVRRAVVKGQEDFGTRMPLLVTKV